MGLAALDQGFARFEDIALGEWAFAQAERLVLEAHLPGQRVDKPRLAPGLLPHGVHGSGRELLTGLGGVLVQQGRDLRCGKISEAEGPGLDVEGAATGDDLLFGTRMNAVVPHVAYAAKDHALRKPVRAIDVAGTQLAKHRDQRVAHQRVDLVDQQHQRR